MQIELIVLRLVHILGGIFWLGAGIFTTYFLVPALTKTGGPITGQVMSALQQRKLFTWLPLSALLTILSGIRLWWKISGGDLHYFQHRSGHTYAIAGMFAITAFVLSLVVSRPAAVRVATLAHATASDETSRKLIADEVTKLQRRATYSGHTAMVLLILAAAGMAIARYL